MNQNRTELATALGLAFFAVIEYAIGAKATAEYAIGAKATAEVSAKEEVTNDAPVAEEKQTSKRTSSRRSAAAKKEESAVEKAADSEITLATVEAAIAEARSKATPSTVRKIVKDIAGTPAANDIHPNYYAEVIEALANIETAAAPEKVEHPDEPKRGEMVELLTQVANEIAFDVAKDIIRSVGGVEEMADIPADKILDVIDECEAELK